jgi:hypothetical protein
MNAESMNAESMNAESMNAESMNAESMNAESMNALVKDGTAPDVDSTLERRVLILSSGYSSFVFALLARALRF